MSVSSLSLSQSSERSSDTAVSSLSPSSVVSMMLQGRRGAQVRLEDTGTLNWLTEKRAPSWSDAFVHSHRGCGRGRGFERRRLVLSFLYPLMRHLRGVGSRGVGSGDFLDVRVRFGAFLNAECLVEGAPQLWREAGKHC